MQDGTKQGDYCKLIQSLLPKKNYVLHYRNLQYYIKHGFVVDEIHIGLKFHQSDWMKLFIDTNTLLRAQATDEVSKSLFKLMNNSVYGKTVENVRERFKLDFVGNIRQAQRLISLPTYSRFHIIRKDLITVQRNKTSIHFDKPIYVGVAVLDISKLLMYEFHYEYMKPLYGDRARLCFTDTDSFLYKIETNKAYEDMMQPENRERFDWSDFPSTHRVFTGMSDLQIQEMKSMNKKVSFLSLSLSLTHRILSFPATISETTYSCHYV